MHISSVLLTLAILCGIRQIHAGTFRPRNLNGIPQKFGKKRLKRETQQIHSCEHKVYCQGNLLHTIQMAKLFPDSKTFVDMSQKNDEKVTLENFEKLMKDTNNQPSKNDLKKFVNDNFELEAEAEPWTPADFNANPKFLATITDSSIKEFARKLIGIWPILGRRIRQSVKDNAKRYSLIPVPEPYIIPGGRFREIYYWDSYWIVQALLIGEMKETVKGMLSNFIYFIKHYGLIPNGARLYYLNRSQPPLFTAMVGLYLDYTEDTTWLAQNIHYIEAEMDFWLNKRVVTIKAFGTKVELAHYGVESNTPRPESYREDIETCEFAKTEVDKHDCYSALKTGAETGWDFSSRFIFDEHGGVNANLSRTDSARVIPVDLNAYLCKSFRLLSDFHGRLRNLAKQVYWEKMADKWQKAMEILMYNSEDGIWYDYDYELDKHRKYFFPSNFATLWAECYDTEKSDELGRKAHEYLHKNAIDQYLGGIPTSLDDTGEQWDFPNAWPPLQELVVLGLHKTGNKEAQATAREFADRWVASNMIGFEKSGDMFEKYDVINPGKYGGGGEYAVQVGFGWTNGIALSFIHYFNRTSFDRNAATSVGTRLNMNMYLIYYTLSFIGVILL